jgi:ankyrin repeat protein
VADAEINPKFGHEISEPGLFRFLLNEETIEQLKEAQTDMPQILNVLSGIDKLSKITLFGTYQSSIDSVKDGSRVCHVFIVFKTASKRDGVYWWSLEKSVVYIVLQRSRHEDDVKTKYDGEERTKVKAIAENLKGKGSIRDLFAILWAEQVIPENYNIFSSNCQSFVTLVSKRITEEEYEYKGYFKYSIRENDRNAETLNLINVVTGITTVAVTVDTKIIDLLLAAMKKVKDVDHVDDLNEEGSTALHCASMASNETTAEHLIKKGADIHYRAKSGETPLHFAALHADHMRIIDLLLANIKEEDIEQYKNDEYLYVRAKENKNGLGKEIIDQFGEKGIVKIEKPKISDSYEAIIDINAETSETILRFIEKGNDPTLIYFTQIDGLRIQNAQNSQEMDRILKEGKFAINDRDKDGETPLHYATRAENFNSVSYLLEKGADPTIRDKVGFTPFDMAAMLNKETKILELLLAHEKVDLDKRDESGRTILQMAIMRSNVTTARFLLSKGANPNIADENKITLLHWAAKFAKNS